ncbi:Hypothetical protein I595_2159 [Croceitalea dokdonensis DOKDO 023]|uniref:Anhydro-N-acetylmuramic acid kinase n=1 Tax=Croceitalea dokdonensis DOKDO 023 TaxID=1300341 RepID=A0A0P7AYW6_9FLAO|nr:anhydro-N-acetylmuramic acid kinase [Croceitalea dokdonensis]KPM31664.1 Hypothetical protein I595_2159 [Croceitalea dokdonensis DOKDO 023]
MTKYNVLGMMSGTSLDGLDIALCHIWQEAGAWNFAIRQTHTVPYDKDLLKKLKNAIHLPDKEHEKLHDAYGIWLGEQAKMFIEKHAVTVDFIASHGHTSHHRPEEGVTFQLGNGRLLAKVAKHKVICDFRAKDVALGGQGAPLVPIGDQLLLPEYDFCLNLGGISNISFDTDGKRVAFDIGLANMPLNYLTEKIGLKYDENGQLARKGTLIPRLLAKLNALHYYTLPYPKSTGYEWFSETVVPLLQENGANTADALHTVIHHNCEQIAKVILGQRPKEGSQVLVTGGGALNSFFMDTLQEKLGKACKVHIPPKKFIEYKEALVFAFMAVLREIGEINVLASVTGAQRSSCSGVIFMP